ncbi:SRPBCC domain-containing protein [Bradyrhizobium sp. NP1]|uniref:CoxG family protein n=1 Tax=Bradyrhizobium sp. NP1 TaxID=3049772 RepID=UPI0025A559F0|nr:SRPBCC domain-containing protein [Bradyrhizobium sp. NP1]WJR79896.1 SRPBCC domain-containing protein [Bradyrhizobium sp. NP1]
MQFAMSMDLPAAPERMWGVLTDVKRISECIPGCENVEEIVRLATYKATVKQKIGPFKLEVPADIVVDEVVEPSRVGMHATGRDKFTGTRLSVALEVTLVREGHGAKLNVSAQLDVQGRLATLGMSVIKRRAEQNFQEFETRLRAVLETV